MQSIGCSQTLSSWPVTPLIKMPSGIVIWMVSKQNYRGSSQRETSTLCWGIMIRIRAIKRSGEYFEEAGIHLLIDECAETEDFLIVGRDDILGNPARKGISELFAGVDTEKPKIVIDHTPLGIEDAVKAGAALILCEHTRKGQFFPATLFTKWAYGSDADSMGTFRLERPIALFHLGPVIFSCQSVWGRTAKSLFTY